VRIIESRPHSKTKHWELLSRERAASEVEL
jgi:ribosomal protein S17